MKKGAVWEFWVFGTVAAFIAIMIFYTFTPFLQTLSGTARIIGNFTNQTVNNSFHNMLTYNLNLWNLFPIVVVAIVFILFFIAASEEEELQRGRF